MKKLTNQLIVQHPTGSYPVIVDVGLLGRVRELGHIPHGVVLISDTNVAPLYADKIGADLVVVVPAGEKFKTLETVRGIYDEMLNAGIDRTATVVALGGGVVGDMAGFVAATYMRGIRFVQCPTTVLSMVDASVGAKTGVDMPHGKNLIGAFKQPEAVLADVDTLATLPKAEFVSGMAEVVKHGLLASPEILNLVESGVTNKPTNQLTNLLLKAIAVKQNVVQADPFEHGVRATLNLGHTFGHAIEQVSGYGVRHGEGVAMGLVCAGILSAKLGHCSPSVPEQIEGWLETVGLPTRIPKGLDAEAIVAAMGSDKKKNAGKLRFILIRAVGDAFVTGDVPLDAVLETIHTCQD